MNAKPTLVIGNKNYSSWSLRPWILLRQFGIAFDEVKLPLDTPEFHARIGAYSPAGRVPVLIDGNVHVWDSLAICEYANDYFLDGRGWPAGRAARGSARAISAEMHSGFSALRTHLPMNTCRRESAPAIGADTAADIARIRAIWREARERHGANGPFLFGGFSIADAMYAPVASRFVSYAVELGAVERGYVEALFALPALRAWMAEAATESLAVEHETTTP
ncbi:MAG: glutathione S-transferase family protein [Proteobacteria bacterium]|nr:glutathione S-transferase family protein [Pseudomonadota bacterium]